MALRIPGKQIVLRDYRREDIDTYIHWQQPGHRWQELDGPYYAKPDAEAVARIRERWLAYFDRGETPTLADPRTQLAIARAGDENLLGVVTRYWISEETLWSAVGIVIFDPAHWGQGYGYEALGLWSQYLFDAHPDWVRLDLRTWSGNTGMLALARKLGYQQEACFRMARIVAGEYYDGLGYGVLRSEWDTLYPGGFAANL